MAKKTKKVATDVSCSDYCCEVCEQYKNSNESSDDYDIVFNDESDSDGHVIGDDTLDFDLSDDDEVVDLDVSTYVVGDVVALNSGGPPMTVTAVDEDNGNVICNFFASEDSSDMSEVVVPMDCVNLVY